MRSPLRLLTSGLRWFRRKWWKLLLAGAGTVLLLLGIAVYGLRYGFVPLPKVPPGFTLPHPPPGVVLLETATNGWAAIRDLHWVNPRPDAFWSDHLITLAAGGSIVVYDGNAGSRIVTNFTQLCDLLLSTPAPGREELDSLTEWLRQPEQFASVVAPTGSLSRWDADALGERLDIGTQWGLVLAGRAIEHRQSREALAWLSTAWTIETTGWLLRGGYSEHAAEAVGFVHLLSISDVALDREEACRWLNHAGDLEGLLPSVKSSYVASVQREFPQPDDLFPTDIHWRQRTWHDWRDDVADDLRDVWDHAGGLAEAILLKVSGGEENPSGFDLPVADWGGSAWYTLAIQLARPEDLERVLIAGASEGLDLLAATEDQTVEGLKRAEARLRQPLGAPWWLFVSQPVAWMRHKMLPWVSSSARAREASLWRLETARLLLALRLRRDAKGRWPDALAELVPEYLDRLPVDPYNQEPFRYRRRGRHWVLWLPDHEGRDPDNWAFDGVAVCSARCMVSGRWEGWDWLTCLRAVGSQAFFGDTPALDDLLALLPPGAGNLEPGSEPPSLRMDELMMRRYGLLPPGP